MFYAKYILVLLLFDSAGAHFAEVQAPWIIPSHVAHSFLKAPTRNKRSDPRCNTEEVYCENNKAPCMLHNEQSREYYCGLSNTCTSSQACYLSTPCPAHYVVGCTDDKCLSFPCSNGATCNDTSTHYTCECVPGYDPATDCATDYDECQSVPCKNGGSCNNLFNRFTCDCSPRFEGDICEKDCRPGPADIVFVVDTSNSVEDGVNKSINFIEDFIDKIPIGPNDFQIGVITYNFDPVVLFDLDDHASKSGIIAALQTIRGYDAATYTAPALLKAKEMLSTSSMGSRGISSYLILLYDGLSTDRMDAINAAISLNAMGLRMLTVGIGESISHSEMVMISDQQYYTYSPLHLNDTYSQIMWETSHTDCTDCSLQTDTQMIFLLDTNNNQTIGNYNERLASTRRIIEKVLRYNPNTQIGMYSYSSEPDEIFSLSWSNDKDKLIAAALQVDIDNHMSIANTSHALQHIRDGNLFTSSRRILVLLSNGIWDDGEDIKGSILSLEQSGTEVVGVIAGEDTDIDSYSQVTNDPSKLFYVGDGDFTALESLAAMTKYYTCIDDIFTKRQ